MKDKKVVLKHSSSIQISNKINLVQRRAWNLLLANAFDELNSKEIFSVRLADLRSMLNYDRRNNEFIKDILRSLVDLKMEWNVLDKDKNQEWGITTLLAEARIINGECFYAYAPTLRKKLHNPTMYAKINLSLQNKFDSKHSLALYELFVDYLVEARGYGETRFIKIEELRKLLGFTNDEYTEYKILNRDILKKSITEINSKSDLFIKMIAEKDGRSVVAVKFYIKKNPKSEVEIDTFIPLKKDHLLLPLSEPEIDNQELFTVLTEEFGISKNKAVEILKGMDEFYIRENLDIVRGMVKKGKIKDIPGYTISAIKNDFRSKTPKDEIEKKEAKKELIEVQEHREQELNMGDKLYRNFIKNEINPEIHILVQGLSKEEKANFNHWVKKNTFYKIYKTEEEYYKFNIYLNYFKKTKQLLDVDERFIIYATKKGYSVKKTVALDTWTATEI